MSRKQTVERRRCIDCGGTAEPHRARCKPCHENGGRYGRPNRWGNDTPPGGRGVLLCKACGEPCNTHSLRYPCPMLEVGR